MKILVVSSSPHKEHSQTFLLTKEVLKGCLQSKSDIHTTILHLSDLSIQFCHHCQNCHKKILDCPIEDDLGMIWAELLAADGIIFASPNYINQITASMKALWDRSSHFIHCQRLLNKYVAGVVTSGSGRDKSVLEYISYYANICGAQYSGGVSSSVPVKKDKIKVAFQLGNTLVSDIKGSTIFPKQKKVTNEFKAHFKKVMLNRKEDWSEEYQYWQERGWL